MLELQAKDTLLVLWAYSSQIERALNVEKLHGRNEDIKTIFTGTISISSTDVALPQNYGEIFGVWYSSQRKDTGTMGQYFDVMNAQENEDSIYTCWTASTGNA